jgi:CheY-like chemotaxis protein
VFLNLLVNAAQAIPEGHADANLIRIATRNGPANTVIVEITDSGTGMTPEVQARLFEPFFTNKPTGIGTGLGLTICQRIMTAAGGKIEVESTPGQGTTFRVILPAARISVATVSHTPAAPSTVRRGRVLIIDDEPTIGSSLMRLLGRDHDVVATTSAREALERILGGESFDVILCDLMMPVMTGIEFYQQLASLMPNQVQRIIFLTGGAFTAAARSFLDQCPNLRIGKPFELAALRALVASQIK